MSEDAVAITPELLSSMKMAKIFKDCVKEINSIDFSKDGQYLVSCDDEALHLYDVQQGKKTKTFYNKVREIDQVKFTHHNQAILCVSKKDPFEIYYWSLHDNEIIKKFIGHTDQYLYLLSQRITYLEMNPACDQFLSCSRDMTLRIWDLGSPFQECVAILDLSSKKTHCVAAFDPTGVAFAVAFQEVYGGASLCRMYLYDMKKFETVSRQQINKGSFNQWKYECPQLKVIKFSPSGKEILGAAQDNYIFVIDAFNGKKICEMSEYQNDNTVIEASFTPDSNYILSGSETGHIYIWSSRNGELVVKLEGHVSRCRVVRFCPNMALIASGCKSLVFWQPVKVDQDNSKQQITV